MHKTSALENNKTFNQHLPHLANFLQSTYPIGRNHNDFYKRSDIVFSIFFPAIQWYFTSVKYSLYMSMKAATQGLDWFADMNRV